MNELTDASQASLRGQLTTGSGALSDSYKPVPPETSKSMVEQYKSAKRLKDPILFSLPALLVTAVICLAIGILVGFIGGFLMGK
jgi:lipopolysaccharide/colanic/teichoic acid biosynthesis glycosyltransferase